MKDRPPPSNDDIFKDSFKRLGLLPAFTGWIRSESFAQSIVVEAPTEILAGASEQVVADLGKLQYSSKNLVVGTVGTGLWNMNPSILRITISDEVSTSRAIIEGSAKEGMIRQDSARKAVDMFIRRFEHFAPPEWNLEKP